MGFWHCVHPSSSYVIPSNGNTEIRNKSLAENSLRRVDRSQPENGQAAHCASMGAGTLQEHSRMSRFFLMARYGRHAGAARWFLLGCVVTNFVAKLHWLIPVKSLFKVSNSSPSKLERCPGHLLAASWRTLMAANQQLTQTDANALCSKGLSHTCSDRWIPVVGMLDAACCEMHCTVSLNHISHTRYVPDGVSVLLRCFARERLVEEMRRVQAPQSSRNNNSNSNKKKSRASQSRVSLWAPGQSLQSVQFVRNDFYLPPGCFSKQFPQQQCHMLWAEAHSQLSQPSIQRAGRWEVRL